MVDTRSSNDGRRPTVSPEADAALEAALAALRRWADEVGVDTVRVIGPLAGLVAEQRVCALLGLAPAANAIQAGWDATDERGRTYQIKARAFTGRRGTSFDFRSEHGFDEALLVLYDPDDLSLVEVWRMPRATVLRHANATPRSTRAAVAGGLSLRATHVRARRGLSQLEPASRRERKQHDRRMVTTQQPPRPLG